MRVVFCLDFTRPCLSIRNASWMYGLFGHLVEKIGAIPIGFENSLYESIQFKIYGNVCVDEMNAIWAKNFSNYVNVQNYMDITVGDFVVGFEIPPGVKEYLNKNNIRYINFVVHPIRFVDDVVLAATTTCDHIRSVLEKCRKNFNVDCHRSLISAYFCNRKERFGNCDFFIAQSRYDSSVIHKGAFIQKDQVVKKLAKHRSDERKFFIVPHPCDIDNPIVEAVCSEFSNASLFRDCSIYEVFANSEKSVEFYTISSSAGREAEEFGFKCTWLMDKNFGKGSELERECVPLDERILSAEFWDSVVYKKQLEFEKQDFKIGFVRKTLYKWSYPWCESDVIDLRNEFNFLRSEFESFKRGQLPESQNQRELEIAELNRQLAESQNQRELEIAELSRQLSEARKLYTKERQEVLNMENSTCWKITKPIRHVANLLNKATTEN